MSLESYISKDINPNEVVFVEELEDVVKRIAKFVPPEEMDKFFLSNPNQTGGRRVFPYCRVDSSLWTAVGCIDNLIHYRFLPKKQTEIYEQACRNAFRVFMWVEIGFEGLDNLLDDPTARKSLGYYWIIKEGDGTFSVLGLPDWWKEPEILASIKSDYQNDLRKFADYYFTHPPPKKIDYFKKYGVKDRLKAFFSL